MELLDVLNLFQAIVVRIDNKKGKVCEYYHSGVIINKEMNLKTFFKKVFPNCEDEANENVFKSLENWIYDTNGISKSTSFKYASSTNELATIYTDKVSDEQNTLISFANYKDAEKYPLIDSLTGVYDNGAFEQIMHKKIQNHEHPFFLAILDIDNLANYNMLQGRGRGDEALHRISAILQELFPDSYIARKAGDTFVIYCETSVDYQNVWDRLHRLFDIYTAERKIDKNLEDVTFTIGVSRFGVDGDGYEELYTKARRALQRGKNKGKNCFIIYLDELHRDVEIKDESEEDEQNEKTSLHHLAQITTILNKQQASRRTMIELLAYIKDYFKSDYVALFKIDDGIQHCLANNSDDNELYVTPINSITYAIHKIAGVVDVMRVYDLYRTNEALYNYLYKENHIMSLVKVDIVRDNQIIGAIEIGTQKMTRFFSTDDIGLMKAIAKILASYELLDKLAENKLDSLNA